jgi:hypothetical protein
MFSYPHDYGFLFYEKALAELALGGRQWRESAGLLAVE